MNGDGSLTRDIDLVLVTGAGASHEFGVNGTKVPLMATWSNALVDKLWQRSPSYVEATGLDRNLSGPEFERRLGAFLRLVEALPLIGPVLKPSLEFQAISPQLNVSLLQEWNQGTIHHVGQITALIHESLHEEFSVGHIDRDDALQASGTFLGQLGVNNSTSMVYATTNYDVVGEYVIEGSGGIPDWGAPRQVSHATDTRLRVDDLLKGLPRYIPVLHLHGRVGWYRNESGQAFSGEDTGRPHPSGVPIALLPDPDKEYDSDPVISTIWRQFVEALQRAKRVVVLGHSLNDELLRNALRDNIDPPERLAVTVRGKIGEPGMVAADTGEISEILARELPRAAILPVHFAQNSVDVQEAVRRWDDRLSEALNRQV